MATTPTRTSIDFANRQLRQMHADLVTQERAFKETVGAKDAEIAMLRAENARLSQQVQQYVEMAAGIATLLGPHMALADMSSAATYTGATNDMRKKEVSIIREEEAEEEAVGYIDGEF